MPGGTTSIPKDITKSCPQTHPLPLLCRGSSTGVDEAGRADPWGSRGWGGRTRIVPGGRPPGGAQVWLGHFLWNQESSADPLSIPALPEWAVEGVWASRGQRGVLEVSALPRARHLRLPAAILEKASGRQALLCIPWIPLLVHQHSALPQPSAAPRTRIACL